MSTKLTKKLKKQATDLFLRSIGLTPMSPQWNCKNLRNDLNDYIENTFRKLNCCVLWFKSLDNSTEKKEELPRILKKYGIVPVYEKFSIIITGCSILYSEKTSFPPVRVNIEYES